MSGLKTNDLTGSTREQYETLIGFLEESNELQEKTISVLEQQVRILEELLRDSENKLLRSDQRRSHEYRQ